MSLASPVRVALLRGINVGGSGLLRMNTLRNMARRLGFQDVATLGASGNLLYRSSDAPEMDARKLEAALARRLGRGIVVVRDTKAMDRLVARDRFISADPAVPDKWRFVAFVRTPNNNPLPSIPDGGPIRLIGRSAAEVFYTMSAPASAAVSMARLLERGLGTPVTIRNWNVAREIAKRLKTLNADPGR